MKGNLNFKKSHHETIMFPSHPTFLLSTTPSFLPSSSVILFFSLSFYLFLISFQYGEFMILYLSIADLSPFLWNISEIKLIDCFKMSLEMSWAITVVGYYMWNACFFWKTFVSLSFNQNIYFLFIWKLEKSSIYWIHSPNSCIN